MADHEIGVHHLDVAGGGDHSRGHLGRPAGGELEALRPLALHAERDLLHVEDDIGDILADTREARELMKHVLDLDRRDGGALQRGQQHTAQRVAERQAEATLERLGDEARLAHAVAARLLFEAVRLLEFLPVLCVDSHCVPLGVWQAREAACR